MAAQRRGHCTCNQQHFSRARRLNYTFRSGYPARQTFAQVRPISPTVGTYSRLETTSESAMHMQLNRCNWSHLERVALLMAEAFDHICAGHAHLSGLLTCSPCPVNLFSVHLHGKQVYQVAQKRAVL